MIGKRKDIGKITGLICEVTLMKDFSWKIFMSKKKESDVTVHAE